MTNKKKSPGSDTGAVSNTDRNVQTDQAVQRNNTAASPLRQAFASKLKASCLAPAEAKKLHYELRTNAPKEVGIQGGGFVIPYFDLTGKPTAFYRYRILQSKGFAAQTAEQKRQRYTQPAGATPELYLPPLVDWRAVADDPSLPLVITEGELKAACGCARTDYPTLGLGGVENWKASKRGLAWLPAFNAFQWEGRHVYIAFDSDAETNPNVQRAERALATVITQWGAVVHVVRVPYSATAKVGLDDYVAAHGAAAWRALVDGTPPCQPDAARAPAPHYSRLSGDAAAALDSIAWRVKGALPARGIAQIYGPPGSGKTFLALDMALAIAAGQERWFGFRVKQAPVTYLFLEGEAGAGQRLRAWAQHHKKQLPSAFGVITQPFCITDPAYCAALAETLPQGGAVFIDTQARAAPGIDENSNEDMSRVIAGASALAARCNGIAVLVAHTGKNASKGVRGHSSQAAAMDAAIEVERDDTTGAHTWRVAKQKDGRDGQVCAFKLDGVELGKDADGDVIASCVVNPNAKPPAKRVKGIDAKLLVDAYRTASAAGNGEVRDDAWVGAHEDALQAAFYKLKEGAPNAQRKAFGRAINSLRKDELLTVVDHIFHITEASLLPLETEYIAAATGTPPRHSRVAQMIHATPPGAHK